MRISTKLTCFFLGVVVLFMGLSATLLAQINVVSAGYDELIEGAIRHADQARVAQVDFKKQVQEWKNILLRGHQADDLARYSKAFHEQEARVRREAQILAETVTDEAARQLLAEFHTAHGLLGTQYQRGLEVFVASSGDYRAADKLLRGKDRAPTDLFDAVVARLDARVQGAVALQKAAVARNRNLALGAAGVLLALLGAAGFVIVHGIVSRLRRLKAVSDRLARADVDGLAVDISGRDEVGEFGESMKGVHAAIEELSAMARVRAAS